jgi:hypothetical protein
MALTVAKVSGADYTSGNKKVRVRTITFDSSYPTAGEALSASDLGLKAVQQFIPHGSFRNADGTLGIVVSYDYTNAKLIAHWGNAGTASGMPEVSSTTDLSAYSGRVTVVGH